MTPDAYGLYVIELDDQGEETVTTKLGSHPSRQHAMYLLERHRFRLQNESGGKATFDNISDERFDLIDASGKRRTRYEIRKL
jgi:hypothetical protein